MPKLSRFHTKAKRARVTRWCPYHASVDDESLEGKLMQEIGINKIINTKIIGTDQPLAAVETEQQQQQQPMMPQQYSESPDLDTVVETSIGDHSALVVEAALPLVEHVESTFMVEVALVESACQDTVAAPSIPSRIVTAIQCLGFDCNENSFDLNLCISNCVPELCTTVPQGSDPPTIRSSNKCWEKNTQFYHF